MGNVRSVAKAFESIGARVIVTANPRTLLKSKALILPGVGAFAAGMRNLRKRKLITQIKAAVKEGKPFFGICLGLQLLFSKSQEHGVHKGLDIISGDVIRFRSNLKIPHMGWNTIKKIPNPKFQIPNKINRLSILKGIADGAYFYFVHSYYVRPKNKKIVLVTCEYGQNFACVVKQDNVYGIQFHPEKSSELGLKILENFCKYVGEIS